MISFKWRHFQKEMILMAVRWYVAYYLRHGVSNCLCSNIKKLVNHFFRGSKELLLGDSTVLMYPFIEVFNACSPVDHGMHHGDIQINRNRQRVNPVLRLISPVCTKYCVSVAVSVFVFKLCGTVVQNVRKCMREHKHAAQFRGVVAFTEMVWWYYEAFHDRDIEWTVVIRRLSYVAVFIRHWNRWVHEKKLPQKHRLTAQTCLHVEISVHAAVNLIGVWREPRQPPVRGGVAAGGFEWHYTWDYTRAVVTSYSKISWRKLSYAFPIRWRERFKRPALTPLSLIHI